MKEFIIATNNAHKVAEIERILSPLGFTAVTAKQRGQAQIFADDATGDVCSTHLLNYSR